MTTLSQNEETVALHHQRMIDLDMAGQADLFSIDGVIEIPFAPPAFVNRIEGREAIRGFLIAAGERVKTSERLPSRYDKEILHRSPSSDQFIYEFEVVGQDPLTGPFRLPYVQVLLLREGEIMCLRDYFTLDTASMKFG